MLAEVSKDFFVNRSVGDVRGWLYRSSLVEAADFVPYMPSILPGIKELLVDPVPEVRKIVALALGAMVGKVWELKPW